MGGEEQQKGKKKQIAEIIKTRDKPFTRDRGARPEFREDEVPLFGPSQQTKESLGQPEQLFPQRSQNVFKKSASIVQK